MNLEPIVRIHGEKCNLCIFSKDKSAIEKYLHWLNDETIAHNIRRNSLVTQVIEEENYVNSTIPKTIHKFNICLKNGTLIGNCALEEKLYRSGRIGILIGEESARNKGIGTEVINMLVKYGFEELGLHSISLTLNAENTSAYKCYTKAGFKACGYLHQNIYHHGIWYDTLFMEILSTDYFNNKLKKVKEQKNIEDTSEVFEPIIK